MESTGPRVKVESDLGSDFQAPFSISGMTEESSWLPGCGFCLYRDEKDFFIQVLFPQGIVARAVFWCFFFFKPGSPD